MFKNLLQIFHKPLLSSSTLRHQGQAKYMNHTRDLSKEEQEYSQELQSHKSILREVLLGESKQVLLLKKCVVEKSSPQKVLQYGEQAIWEHYKNQDYLNTIKCCEIVLPYISNNKSKEDSISFGHLSLILAESYISQNQTDKALASLQNAEESFYHNCQEFESVPSQHYYYSLQLADLYSKVFMFDKTLIFATISLKINNLAFEQKISPCYLITQYYMHNQNYKEALSFGQKFLKEVTFSNLINTYSPKEIKILQDFQSIMIDLMYEVEKDYQKSYVLIDQMLLLLDIIKSQDKQLIDLLNQKKYTINKKLKNQEDLLFVLGFYGQKLKLEQDSFSNKQSLQQQQQQQQQQSPQQQKQQQS